MVKLLQVVEVGTARETVSETVESVAQLAVDRYDKSTYAVMFHSWVLLLMPLELLVSPPFAPPLEMAPKYFERTSWPPSDVAKLP